MIKSTACIVMLFTIYSVLFNFTGKCFPVKLKTLREDAHCGVYGRCRKRPPQARECAKMRYLFNNDLIFDDLNYSVDAFSAKSVFTRSS